jgi:hypothetical protein
MGGLQEKLLGSSEFESYPAILKPSLRKAGSGRVCPISRLTYFIEIVPKMFESIQFFGHFLIHNKGPFA